MILSYYLLSSVEETMLKEPITEWMLQQRPGPIEFWLGCLSVLEDMCIWTLRTEGQRLGGPRLLDKSVHDFEISFKNLNDINHVFIIFYYQFRHDQEPFRLPFSIFRLFEFAQL